MEINAIYKIVSAKTGEGIDDLFKTIGKIFLHRNKKIDSEQLNENSKKCNIF